MELGRRNTKKYTFKCPDLTQLKKLGSMIVSPEDFKAQYGRLMGILKTKVEDGVLNTLVQFYDPLYHCFTFLDYQRMPTLEEYSYWFGLQVSNKLPFRGSKKTPTSAAIAEALHLETSVVKDNFAKKGGIIGLTSRFLLEKAFIFAEADSRDAFEAIFSLLIYGIVLFLNIDDFMDVNAIRIFLIGNPVPILLGDTYHSIHHRTKKGGGTILCCAPLLYKWFISHLPRSRLFRENPQKLRWSQRFMSIDQGSIHWYDPSYDVGVIIDSCGEFLNVPLIGVHGGINYNPILARRQLGYPMAAKPDNLLLSGFFHLNDEESFGLKDRIIHAWRNIHRKGKDRLGRKNCVAFEPYTQWVCARSSELKMPYALEKTSSPFAITSSSTIPIENKEEFQEVLDRLKLERDTWEGKYHVLNDKKMKMEQQLKEKDDLIEILEPQVVKKHEEQECLLLSKVQPFLEYSSIPPTSGAWKGIVDKLMIENAQLKRQKMKHQPAVRPSTYEIP
ncbi:uncharacterized protein LOC127122385 [Lathyrus oleraceus]|uniref:uncharacterized protein LOC127122385 n=1 Tax=Pisum sativum TaxID=3888 RepID=UPI0021D22E27|nr:uncharacterized protein LOC127122385 [Pisum sativum]